MSISEKPGRACILVALLSIVVFANSLANDFVWDDKELIVANPAVRSLAGIGQFFSGHFWSQSEQPSAQGYYRPIVLLSYAVDHSVWGLNPFGFHLSNIAWHAVATMLVCVLIRKITSSSLAALLGGALFAVHPIHVESVTFISGRTDVIAAAFILCAMIFFLEARNRGATSFRFFISLLFFVLALLSKEVAVVLPAMLLVYEFTVERRENQRRLVLMHAAFWTVAGTYALVRFGLLDIAPRLHDRLSVQQILYTMPFVLADYARLLLFPFNLCADYAVELRNAATPANLGMLLVAFLFCALVVILVLKRSIAGFFTAWIVAFLLPVLQIVPISVLKAERFLYVPSVGFCALAGLAAAATYKAAGLKAKKVLAVVIALVILVLSARTVTRNRVWSDEFTLYRVTEQCAPNNFRVQYNLGNAYYRRGDLDRALRHTELAYRLEPDFPQINYNLGVIYGETGRLSDAERMYRRAIGLDPSYALARNNLALVLYQKGQYTEAKREWQKALSLDPTLESAREGLRLLESEQQ